MYTSYSFASEDTDIDAMLVNSPHEIVIGGYVAPCFYDAEGELSGVQGSPTGLVLRTYTAEMKAAPLPNVNPGASVVIRQRMMPGASEYDWTRPHQVLQIIPDGATVRLTLRRL